MVERERRQDKPAPSSMLHAQLNDDQLMTLRELERFGWELKFVRRPPFQDAVPVVFDPDRRSFAVLRSDGTLDEDSGLNIR